MLYVSLPQSSKSIRNIAYLDDHDEITLSVIPINLMQAPELQALTVTLNARVHWRVRMGRYKRIKGWPRGPHIQSKGCQPAARTSSLTIEFRCDAPAKFYRRRNRAGFGRRAPAALAYRAARGRRFSKRGAAPPNSPLSLSFA
jgi:hypothetical protein